MQAYIELTGREEIRYREQLLRYIPELDRVFLQDFYEKQAKEYEEMKKKSEQQARRAQGTGRHR